jgi:hypothetical protein
MTTGRSDWQSTDKNQRFRARDPGMRMPNEANTRIFRHNGTFMHVITPGCRDMTLTETHPGAGQWK